MTRKLFGTDGIRGQANIEPMTAATALQVGMAAGLQFTRGGGVHRVVLGKDTRRSCYMLENALASGFLAVGMEVVLLGPMPTPAVAMLTKSLRADLGVMISASHNLFQDNGIKLFGPDGYKLSDETEAEIEARMEIGMTDELAVPERLGRAWRLDDALGGRYTEYCKNTFPRDLTLHGQKVVIDAANGAAYRVAPEALWELGAEVVPVGVDPNGFNINKNCGSTSPDAMCQAVVTHGADMGIALDGDADRLIIADETGKVIDGDQIMALIAGRLADAAELKGGGVVATVMSNLGLERHLKARGLDLVRTQVGDRYVVEHMRKHGYNMGGEQSGHIVLADHATTGDGLIAALQVLAVRAATGKPMSELGHQFDRVPQVLKNVRFSGGQPLEDDGVQAAISDVEARLAGEGRLLVRKSGTEPLIRIMAEHDDKAVVGEVVDHLAEVIAGAA
ncbi:MAG: phosphoglucosamine mutase [Pseudomonadota bacterium]